MSGLCSSVWSLGPENSMGFLNLWAIYLFSLLAPLLFLLLAVVIYYWWCGIGAGFQEVGNRSYPRLTFLGQASQTTGIWTLVPQWPRPEPLGGWAEQRALWDLPLACCRASCPCLPGHAHQCAGSPSFHPPSVPPQSFGTSHQDSRLLVTITAPHPLVAKEIGGGASWLKNCFANGSIFV